MEPYRELLQRLPASRFPAVHEMQNLLRAGCSNALGQPIRLVESRSLPELTGDGAYEREIAHSGRVSTRPESLHDLCNALVWARFPLLKAALNAAPHDRPARFGSGPARTGA